MAKRKPAEKPWHEKLDEAVMAAFPGVACRTEYNIFAMQFVSRWTVGGTDGDAKLTPSKARRVKDFVSGYSKAFEDFHP